MKWKKWIVFEVKKAIQFDDQNQNWTIVSAFVNDETIDDISPFLGM